MVTRPNDRYGFEIAIICALPLETDAIRALFDHHWDDPDQGLPFGKVSGDPNTYSTGVIGCHNVVLVYLPGMGKVNASTVASNCRISFPKIRLALVVGVCGVVPFGPNSEEILLGDVIISNGIFQYDFGRRLPDRFASKDTPQDLPGRPSFEIRGLLRKLETIQGRQELINKTSEYLDILRQAPQLHATYPGTSKDRLFEADYLHSEDQKSCEEIGCCGKLVLRHRLEATIDLSPAIHFGLMGSGDTVMKSGQDRDRIAAAQGVIAFEMEGVGVWDVFPCLVIKGACDYADSHKSKVWQRYAAASAAACTKALLSFWAPSNTSPGVPATCKAQKSSAFLVPFDRNDLFVGRADILERLRSLLFEKNCRKVALVGLGGIGKTQTALQLAFWTKKNKPDYSVFWIPAISMAGFHQECEKLVKKLEIPDTEHNDAKEAVRLYLSSEEAGNWLLIIDNADDVDILRNSEDLGKGILEFLPRSEGGRILFTTRSNHVAVTAAIGAVIKLPQMGLGEAKDLFKSLIDEDNLHDDESVAQLLQILNCLPLAIAQAAAYVKMHETPVSEYIRLLTHKDTRNAIELLEHRYNDETYHNTSQGAVATTWVISFNQIGRSNPSAVDLLSFMAYIEPKAIPQFILPKLETEQQLTQAIGTLIGYGFISRRGLQEMYDMHSLVHLATRRWNEQQKISGEVCQMTLARVADVLPADIKTGNPVHWQQCLPHALRLLSTDGIPETKDFCKLALGAAQSLIKEDWAKEAEASLEDATTIRLQTLTEDGSDLLTPQSIPHSALTGDRRYKKAVELCQRSLIILNKQSMKGYPKRKAHTKVMLAIAYLRQRQYKKAVELLESVVTIESNMQLLDSTSQLVTQAMFADTLAKDQQYERAIPLLEHVVADRQWISEVHPARLNTLRQLEKAYRQTGRAEMAVAMAEREVEMQEVLAEHHEVPLKWQYLLARAYLDDKQTNKAIKLLERIVRVQAEESPSWQDSKNLLQWCYEQHGMDITEE
ncbi:hypothetical protein NW762_007646 [Fusarium torreyae]|uniref:Nucleoside phosphorylase domain-containing protein n=1 Tax=Fusarium torreyae TaxID=1237075 RepID=A0A9W8VE59_9HYPO|nr:hypothetical protein NW762_007646 [Fusarium torreyae]